MRIVLDSAASEPDRWDLWGAGLCLVGVAGMTYTPRAGGLDA